LVFFRLQKRLQKSFLLKRKKADFLTNIIFRRLLMFDVVVTLLLLLMLSFLDVFWQGLEGFMWHTETSVSLMGFTKNDRTWSQSYTIFDMSINILYTLKYDQPSISSTLNEQILHTKVFFGSFSSYVLALTNVQKHIHT